MSVEAGQLLYTSVEKEDSPSGRRGFQTVFRTRHLISDDEVSEIEMRLTYRPGENGNVPKWVYFRLPSEKYVVVQLLGLDDVDALRRGGIYLAHGLVLDEVGMARFDHDPTAVLRAFAFCRSRNDLLAMSAPRSGDVEAARLDPGAATPATPQRWLAEPAAAALRFFDHAQEYLETREPVVVHGSPSAVAAVLGDLFALAPRRLRAPGAFDTMFEGGMLSQTPYFMIGKGAGERSRAASVNAADLTVQGAPAPKSLFDRWAQRSLERDGIDSYQRQKESAFALCGVLGGDAERVDVEAAEDSVLADLSELGAEQLWRRAADCWSAVISPAVAGRWQRALANRWNRRDLWRGVVGGFAPNDVAETVYAEYLRHGLSVETAAEAAGVAEAAARLQHAGLRLVAALADQDADTVALACHELSDEAYVAAVRSFAQSGERVHPGLVAPRRCRLFLQASRSAVAVDRRLLVRVVDTILRASEPEALQELTPHLPSLERRDLVAIEEQIVDFHGAEAFRSALQQEITRRGGVFDRILGFILPGWNRNDMA